MKHAQSILAVDTSYLTETLHAVDGINVNIPFEAFFEGAGGHLAIRRRFELEKNESYLQILPYAVIAKGSLADPANLKISAYFRPVSGGESRLHGNLSIGYGGHIDLNDVVANNDSVIDLPETVRRSMARELQEEVALSEDVINACAVQAYGLITDRSNSVGRVHLGVVYVILVSDDWQPSAAQSEIDLAGEFTAAELRAKEAAGEIEMENWTKLIVDQLLA